MKNKKGFLLFGLLTFISCFFCIGDIKAYTFYGVELNDDFFNKGWELLEGKTWNELENNTYSYSTWNTPLHQENFPFVECEYTNNSSNTNPRINCYFLMDYSYSSESSSSVKVNSSTLNNFAYAPGFTYYINTGEYAHNKSNNFSISKSGVSQINFDVYNGETLLKSKSFDYNPGPTSFEFSEIINTNLIDSVEFKFTDIPLSETGIVYNYDFASVFSDGSYSEMQFSQPFGREYYTGCDEETQSCSSSLKSKDYLFYDLDFISRHYELLDVRIFNESPEHITSSYSIILPLEHDIGKYIDIFFHSDYEFEVIFHYKSDEDSTNSYLETIDITNKYGVVFLPWYDNDIYVDRDTFYLTDFKVVGNVDIQVTDSRDPVDYNILQLYSMNYCNHSYQEQTNIPYNCDNLTGVFKFKIDNLTANQTLRFVNHAYSTSQGTKTLITYDTRYFNYTILDTPYSTGEVIDPVTGEKHNINLNDFYNQFNNHSNSGFKSALNRFLSPIKFIFRNISNLFNNYLNQSLQDYFFFAFSLMLIILILRVIF